MPARVLVVEDDRNLCELLELGLGRRGFRVTWRLQAREAIELLEADDFDVVLADVNMPEIGGLELCRRVVEARRELPVVVITAFGSLETAVDAIRAGAYDFVTKPVELEVLALTLERAVAHRALRQEVRRLQDAALATRQRGDLVGGSPAMKAVYDLVDRVGASEASVLISGESGTGKEVVARALHAQSQRHAGPFVAVNCAALPADLLESELFGHVRGAFTGAVRERVGRFEAARGGVLVLDEIGDVALPLQVKLLRVLQERTFERVGESAPRAVDARVIAATNVDLKEAIAAGRFREDLYYRLRVVPIHVAPLRDRPEDVEPLARHLLARITAREGRAVRFSPEVFDLFKSYAWPGNVRELENAIEYAVALCQRQTVQIEDLPPELAAFEAEGSAPPPPHAPADRPGEDGAGEAARIRAALDAHRWHHAHAAAELGISRTTLWRKMRALGLG